MYLYLVIGGGGTLEDSIDILFSMGMARALLGLVDPGTRDDVIRTVSATLSDKYEEGIGMRLGAAAWIAEARVNRRP